ncbi:hypothetical protein CHS0354_030503 [Potamilus streckersoni]|uniref:Integrase zinc-binding domain-containing protein n=1 Tax=Potamilus streckersoni TaxID=2493646 RepID=A0AAE0VGA5_9BIVA|nr:hypothetical protein CHS0354_030503 [Potamilus streckersoni]
MIPSHQSFDRTYESVSSKYYRPKMFSQIRDYVQNCGSCQQAKQPSHSAKAPLYPLPSVSTCELWHKDILGPVTTTREKLARREPPTV